MALQESGQMYLESIFVLSKTGKPVRSIDVSEYMGFSKPSVSRAIGLLKSGGYLTVNKEGHLHLTEEGLRVAENIYEKHTLLTKFLVRLGVSEETASEDACKMEHIISDESFAAIKKHAGFCSVLRKILSECTRTQIVRTPPNAPWEVNIAFYAEWRSVSGATSIFSSIYS